MPLSRTPNKITEITAAEWKHPRFSSEQWSMMYFTPSPHTSNLIFMREYIPFSLVPYSYAYDLLSQSEDGGRIHKQGNTSNKSS